MTAMIGSTTFQTNTVVGEYSQAASLYEVGGYSIKSGDTAILSVYFNPPQQILVPVSSDTAFIDVEYEDSKTGLTYNGGQLGGGRSILTILALDTVLLKVNGTFSGIFTIQTVLRTASRLRTGNSARPISLGHDPYRTCRMSN